MCVYIYTYMFTYYIIYVISYVKVSFDEMVFGPYSEVLWPPGHFRKPRVQKKSDYFPSVRKGSLGASLWASAHAGKQKNTEINVIFLPLCRTVSSLGSTLPETAYYASKVAVQASELHNILHSKKKAFEKIYKYLPYSYLIQS